MCNANVLLGFKMSLVVRNNLADSNARHLLPICDHTFFFFFVVASLNLNVFIY